MDVRPYGVTINDALRDPATKMEHLVSLRDQARAILEEEGDLRGALASLEDEIRKRGGDSAC